MHEFVLNDIPCSIDRVRLAKRVHVDLDSADGKVLLRMVADAEDAARPKAYYRLAFIEDRGEDWVVIDGQRFPSRVLAVNLTKAHRVFLFAATCGVELDHLFKGVGDILESYWADMIKEAALRVGFDAMNRHIEDTWKPGKTSMMSPGSLEDWPITQQVPLFQLLGDVKSRIGLELSDSLLMNPTKSLSGIRFPTEEGFESCQLCPRDVCEGRRAPYQPELMAEKYQSG
jgi:hypothetical protein